MIVAPFFSNHKVFTTLLVLPTLIIMFLVWQYPYTTQDGLSYNIMDIPLAINNDHQTYDASTKSTIIQSGMKKLANLHQIAVNIDLYKITVYIAFSLIFFVFIINATGLALSHSIQNRKHRKTSAQLYRNFRIGLVLFPIILILLLSSSILTTASLLAIILLKYAGAIYALTIFAVAIMIVIALSYQVIKSCRKKPTEKSLNIIGTNLTKTKAPKLWEFVQSIADKGNLCMPNNIVIGINHSFFVTESPINLWHGETINQGATLYLPIPYMNYMNQEEVAAIISHELTHLTYADIHYTQQFFIISKKLVKNFSILNVLYVKENANFKDWCYFILTYPTLVFAEHFLDKYHETVQQWKRSREANADKIGATVTSTKQMGAALLRVALLTPTIEHIINEYWFEGGEQQGILNSIEQFFKYQNLPDPLLQLQSIQSHPLDNHPPLQRRLELLNVKITKTMLDKASETNPSQLLQQLALC